MCHCRGNRLLRGASPPAVFALIFALGVLSIPAQQMAHGNEPIAPVPLNSNIDPRQATLGGQLFHDSRLSHDQKYSCATCHPLDHGGMDGLPVAKSPVGGSNLRNTLTVFNVGLNASYNWDGITTSLEHHTDLILTNPGLMNMSWDELLTRTRSDSGYLAAFQSAYP